MSARFTSATRTTYGLWDGVEESVPMYPGWAAVGSLNEDGTLLHGAIVFNSLAWVDGDGAIIGREISTPDDSVVIITPDHMDNMWLSEVEGHETLIATRGDLASRGLPCEGVDPAALQGASIVFIHGAGPSADAMTWS